MPPAVAKAKARTRKDPPWMNIVNRAIEQNVEPQLSQSRQVQYLRVPNVGRADLERQTQLTAAGREWYRRKGIRFRVPKTVPLIDYANARERTTRDGLQKYIVDAQGGCPH